MKKTKSKLIQDETEYLLSEKANKTHLVKSLGQAEKRKVKSIEINKIWKDDKVI